MPALTALGSQEATLVIVRDAGVYMLGTTNAAPTVWPVLTG